jgi:glycosyltransferase involved in cell wall biosynthesis
MVNSTLHIGGAEQVAATLAQHVDPARFEVSACYLKQPGMIHDQMLRAGVDLMPIPGLVQGKRDYFTSNKLLRLIRMRGIQVVHTHDIHGMIDGAICRLREPSLRLVHTFHYGNYPHRTRWHKFIERSLWRVADALVAVGNEQAASIRALYGIPEDRMRVLWNGVEDPQSRPAAAPPDGIGPADVPTIASVSTLIAQKGLEHLLDAAALLRDEGDRFRLLIAGQGKLREALEAQAARLKLGDCVQFLGWVPQASQRILPLCDIFVQSSRWEAMSVVVLEAMAAGKPHVVTSVGENPHVVLHEKTGLIVPPGDPRKLAQELRRLLRDPSLRAKLGDAARERYREHFTTQHMIAAHESLYRELARPIAITDAPSAPHIR